MEPFLALVPLTEMLLFTVLLVLYFLVGYMVAFFDELHAPSAQLAVSMPATRRSVTNSFELFRVLFIVFI